MSKWYQHIERAASGSRFSSSSSPLQGFMTRQSFSAGANRGLQAGQFSTWSPSLHSPAVGTFAQCVGASSYWNKPTFPPEHDVYQATEGLSEPQLTPNLMVSLLFSLEDAASWTWFVSLHFLLLLLPLPGAVMSPCSRETPSVGFWPFFSWRDDFFRFSESFNDVINCRIQKPTNSYWYYSIRNSILNRF